jgi:drug resistance transporter, EmrB/QacA subfamily
MSALGRLWILALVLAMSNFMAVLDLSIANVSLPNIAGSLGIGGRQGTWVISSYSVAEALVVPLAGWLAGRFGAVRVFTSAMMLFGGFSALCGISESLGMLVFARVMQGFAGGCLMPLSQTLLMTVFPREKAPLALALWAMTTLLAPVLAPVLGGWLCDTFSWPAIFFINVPIAMVCAPIALRELKGHETKIVHAPMDGIGLALMVLFVGSLQLMLDLGRDADWFAATEIRVLALTALIGFAAFLIWELTEKHPIVDLSVFRHRGFTATVITTSLGYGAMFAASVVTPLWLQTIMGYTATWAGLAVAWIGLLALCAAPLAGLLMAKVDPRKLVCLGLAWLAAATAFRAVATTDMGYWQVVAPLMATGLGLPFFFVPLTALALGSVEPEETASAAGLLNFLRTLAGAVATSVVTTTWDHKAAATHAVWVGQVDATGETTRLLASTGMPQDAVTQTLDHLLQSQAVMVATNEIMATVAVAFVISALVVWIAPRATAGREGTFA